VVPAEERGTSSQNQQLPDYNDVNENRPLTSSMNAVAPHESNSKPASTLSQVTAVYKSLDGQNTT